MGSFRSSGAVIQALRPSQRTRRIDTDISSYRNPSRSDDRVLTAVSDPSPTPIEPPVGLLRDAGQLLEAIIRRGDSPHTKRAYALDLRTYAEWLEAEGLAWGLVTPDDLDRYREWLAERYARTTTNRRLSVVRSLYAEAHRRHRVTDDPAARLRGVRGRDERDGGVLTRAEAKEVMDAIHADLRQPTRRVIARRDLALVGLLLRTGIRRSEVVGIRVGDLDVMQGHHIATLRAKGNVVRTIKIPTDLYRDISAWLEAAAGVGITLRPEDPLFVEVRRGGHVPGRHPLSGRAVYDIVKRRLKAVGQKGLGPHSLRATFVTLALEGGAPLHLVQRAAGHADPRTTERYWRRKNDLDDNATDYVRL